MFERRNQISKAVLLFCRFSIAIWDYGCKLILVRRRSKVISSFFPIPACFSAHSYYKTWWFQQQKYTLHSILYVPARLLKNCLASWKKDRIQDDSWFILSWMQLWRNLRFFSLTSNSYRIGVNREVSIFVFVTIVL